MPLGELRLNGNIRGKTITEFVGNRIAIVNTYYPSGKIERTVTDFSQSESETASIMEYHSNGELKYMATMSREGEFIKEVVFRDSLGNVLETSFF